MEQLLLLLVLILVVHCYTQMDLICSRCKEQLYLNKYKFASTLSTSNICVTPLEIQMLLEESQCYLLTAGFGSDHFVVQYFRMIRDDYLQKFSFGRWLVEKYYASAPQYTDYIIETPVVASVIRGLAWTGYLMLNNPWTVLILCVFFLFIFGRKRLFRFNRVK